MADRETKPEDLLAALIGQKHGVTLDASDPVFIIASIFEGQTKEAQAALSKIVAEAAEQMAATIVLSDNAARARAETIVTESARWAGEQIRLAGSDAAKQILHQTEDQAERVESAAQSVRLGVWITCGATAVSLCAMLFVLLK
jgi:hypothetical protein